jgi:hypothetical protein
MTLASFHLHSYQRQDTSKALSRMGFDRPVLAGTDGLVFWRLLGTARGHSMSWAADLRRWALFAVWEDEAALDAFLAGSEVAAFWREHAAERYTVRLDPISGHGRWGPLELPRALPGARGPRDDGPVAALTRAAIRPSRLVRFYRSVAPVDVALDAAPGLLASVGVGEWPLARQATFSLWRSATELRDFAYAARGPHAAVVRRTRAERWYGQELFARFRPYAAEGTWGGRDPLGI